MGLTDVEDESLPTSKSTTEHPSSPVEASQTASSPKSTSSTHRSPSRVNSPWTTVPKGGLSKPPSPQSPLIEDVLSAEEQATAQAYDTVTEAAVEQAQAGIEIDYESDTTSESGSAFDAGYESDSLYSASTSLESSVRDFAFENGRRYHKFREGSYNFPNDPSEQDREDMKHAMMVNLLGGRLHFAPLGENPGNVLDIGTGTGIWAIEMGDLYPSANILGIDLSPIQPDWVPPNVRFMVDDAESPWLKPPNYYDYIHSRHTVMAIRDWPLLMKRALEHLKPGGWMEMQEIHHHPYCHDGSMPLDHPVSQYWFYIHEALANLGVNFNATLLLEDMMRDAGFVNVSNRIFHVPIGQWPKNKVLKLVGLYWRTILIDGLQPIALGPMTRGLKWSREQIEVWLVEVRKAYMDGWVHSHMPLHIICGQKPGGGDETPLTT